MANCFKAESWTPAEEAQLLEMQQRRARVLERQRKPVFDVAVGVTQHEVNAEAITDYLIKHADVLRDALAPYDSGVRAAEY